MRFACTQYISIGDRFVRDSSGDFALCVLKIPYWFFSGGLCVLSRRFVFGDHCCLRRNLFGDHLTP